MTKWIDAEGKIPEWINNAVKQIYERYGGSSSSFLNKYWILKGKHYIYKIYFEGQGGSLTRIVKKPR